MRNGFLMGALALALAGGAIAGQTPAQPAPKARAPKSPAEQKALLAMGQTASPDAMIAVADDFVAKFPNSDYRALAFFYEAEGYGQKNDYDHLVVFGEQALESNPDDGTKLQVLVLLAQAIVAKTGEYDLDREEKLTKVEKYAGGVIDMLKTMSKPNPALQDADWEAAKADLNGQAHEALGRDQMVRKDYDKAIAEFNGAVAASKESEPRFYVRLAGAYEKAEKYDDAVAVCDKVLALPNLDPRIKAAAGAEKSRVLKLKGAATPAKP